VLVGYHDAFDALSAGGKVLADPAHVSGDLANNAVRGAAALQLDNNQRIRGTYVAGRDG
jgi:hypothetical protein